MFNEEMTRANPISSVKKRERRRNSRGKNFRSNRLRSGRLGPITEYRFNNPLPGVTRATPNTRTGRLLITDFCRATHENGLVTGSPCLLYYEPENPLFFGKDFCALSWERTHPACGELETLSTLEACAPRDDLCVLRVSAVKSVLVAARLCENTLSGT